MNITQQMLEGKISYKEAEKQVNCLLDGSELDSLDAHAQSNDAYSIVGESHACGADQPEDSEQTSDETLGKIIDSGNNCPKCKGWGFVDLDDVTEADCDMCLGTGQI